LKVLKNTNIELISQVWENDEFPPDIAFDKFNWQAVQNDREQINSGSNPQQRFRGTSFGQL
jgi:hypothetical protein